MDFSSKEDFKKWLQSNHRSSGVAVFIYKKAYGHLGISYEDAVQAALCFGWIDSVTRRYDDIKFIQIFSPRKPKSNWALSNIKRMKNLIENNEMTPLGLKFFDLKLLDQLENLIDAENNLKTEAIVIPDAVSEALSDQQLLATFLMLTPSHQRMYLTHIEGAKKQETKDRRLLKLVEILKGG